MKRPQCDDAMDETQAATRVAQVAVGDIEDDRVMLVRRVNIEVEPSGEPQKRKPISELPVSGLVIR